MRVISFVLILTTVACAAAAQSPPACSPDDDAAINFLGDVVNLVTSTDPEVAAARESSYKVPTLPASAVQPVRDQATLGRARGALAAYIGRAPSKCIYVLKLGEFHFAVFDPGFHVGHYDTVFVFDRAWRQIGGWTG